MTDYYLEVNDDNLKLIENISRWEIDLKRGDVILVKYDPSTMSVHFNGKVYTHPQFKLCESGSPIKSLSIASAINHRYLIDITKQIERSEKLSQLGL